mgnify:FL=1
MFPKFLITKIFEIQRYIFQVLFEFRSDLKVRKIWLVNFFIVIDFLNIFKIFSEIK